jgi:hypothetical protein
MALAAILTSLRRLLIDRATRTVPEPEQERNPVIKRKVGSSSWDDSESSQDEEELQIPQVSSPKKEVKVEDEDDDKEEALEEGDLLDSLEITERPEGITEEDWIVYSAFQSVTNQFYEKWKKMWA